MNFLPTFITGTEVVGPIVLVLHSTEVKVRGEYYKKKTGLIVMSLLVFMFFGLKVRKYT
jgi:hypothetical protein